MKVLLRIRDLGQLALDRYLPHGRQGVVSFWAMFSGILVLLGTCHYLAHGQIAPLLVAPIGASAILLFGAPQSPMSQPWNVIASHLLAALIGVSCARYLPGGYLPAALALALVLLVLHLCHCMHPPAGATALFAVIGGPSIQALGYTYVLNPVLLNVLLLLVAAWLVNNIIPGRRYPWRLATPPAEAKPVADTVHRRLTETASRPCADLMQPCRLVLPATLPAGHAWRKMMHMRVADAPVVNTDGICIGLISLTDFMKPLPANDVSENNLSPASASRTRVPIALFMRSEIRPLKSHTPLHVAAMMFAEKGTGLMPVVDAVGRPAGIITRRDVLARMAGHFNQPQSVA